MSGETEMTGMTIGGGTEEKRNMDRSGNWVGSR